MNIREKDASLVGEDGTFKLPKLNEAFLPLVAEAKQVHYLEDDYHEYWDQVDNPKNFNRYKVNKDGELIKLFLTDYISINWKLLGQCPALINLTILNSNITSHQEVVFSLPSLKVLDLSNNELTQLPVTTDLLESLTLDSNKLTEINDLSQLSTNIKHLSLNSNKLNEISENIFILPKLIFLSLANNELVKIPKNISKSSKLQHLNLTKNKITEIPNSIGLLKNLHILIIDNNLITKLPFEFTKLDNLRALFANNNKIIEIPKNINKLSNLSHLLIENNQIKQFPNSMIKLKGLINLTIQGNPIPIPDSSFHKLNPQEKIQTILAIQLSETKPLNQAKILVVGDERVGKTSVINRLLGNPHNENQTSTQGIDISELSFNDFDTNIWDFAGQEITHQTHQFFLTERSLYLYVLDAQKEDNQARDLHWLNTIKSYSQNSPIIIVVNHYDQNLNYVFDKLRYQEQFKIVDIIYTSACNLNTLSEPEKYKLGDSISKLNIAITRQLPMLPGIERELPESWHKVKQAMENFKKKQNVIDKDTYEKECENAGVVGKPLQNALLKILNSIGTVVAYPDDFRLRMTQILKPEWVTNAVYKIIRSQSEASGVYSEDVIGTILNSDYKVTHQQWLVDLLIKFELGFRLLDNNQLLIPMRLPSVMPEFDKQRYQRGLNIHFNYHRIGLLKLNVLPQLIVRMHQYVDEQTTKYWRHGMFLRLNDCQGVIIADEPNQCIEVYLTHRDDNARNLLQWLRSNLERIEQSQINASQSKTLPYKEEIALFDEENSKIIGHVNYQRIERAFSNEREIINLEVKNSETGEVDDQDFNVAELLGLYQSQYRKPLELSECIKFLVKVMLRLTELRAKVIEEKEDDINDRLRESLISAGYSVTDQSRGGFSGSGKGIGERDLVLLDEYGQQATLIEAMILESAVKETMESHYKKLTNNYNTQGNKFDFLITYAKVKNLEGLWKKYKNHLKVLDDMTERFCDKHNIKVGRTNIPIEDSDQTRNIIHIMVNFGVKP
jgi:internalin A